MPKQDQEQTTDMASELIQVVMNEREVRCANLTHTIKWLKASILSLESIIHLSHHEHAQIENLEALKATLDDMYLWQKELLQREKENIDKTLAHAESIPEPNTYH